MEQLERDLVQNQGIINDIKVGVGIFFNEIRMSIRALCRQDLNILIFA